MESKIGNVGTQLIEMGKAIIILQSLNDKIPAFVRDQVSQLKDVHEEKIDGVVAVVGEKIKSLSDVTTQQFISINDKFAEKDKGVIVGLSAQKESAAAQQASNAEAQAKMESNFTALLNQGRELLAEVRKSTEQQLNDIKTTQATLASRLDRGEGRTSVSDPATAEALKMLAVAVGGLNKSTDTSAGASDNWKTVGMIGGLAIAALALFVKSGGFN